MRFNVAQLLREGSGTAREYVVSAMLEGVDADNPDLIPVEGQIVCVRSVRGILVTGAVELDLVQRCRRCMERFGNHLELEIEEEFITTIDLHTGEYVELTDDDEPELLINEHHILDLEPVLQEYIIVASARSGLCSSDCKGLCPVCGISLNTGACQCEQKAVDPRFAVLAQLLDGGSDNNARESG